jgi:hypothetical protein
MGISSIEVEDILKNNMSNIKEKNNESKPVAIKVRGKLKDATIEDNISIGANLLEADEIEGGSISRNKTILSPTLNIKNSQLHFGRGDNTGRDKKNKDNNSETNFFKKYWWGLIIPIIIILVSYGITEGKLPQLITNLFNANIERSLITNISTSTINIADVLNKMNSFKTSLERNEFINNYKGNQIYGTGLFMDIFHPSMGYILTINISKNKVSCVLVENNINENQLRLLKTGQNLSFTGIFNGSVVFETSGWLIDDCVLLD